MTVRTDAQGRSYPSSEPRERHGERSHVVTCDDRIGLVPVGNEPLEAVREADGDAFDDHSITELRETAFAEARTEARESQ